MPERVTRRGLLFLLTLFVIVSLLLVATVTPFFPYVFFGAFAAFLVWPAYVWLSPRIGRYFAAWGLVAAVYAVVFVPLGLLVLSIVRDLTVAIRHFVEEETTLGALIDGVIADILPENVAPIAAAWLTSALQDLLVRVAGQIVGRSMEVLLGIFIFGFVLFYSLLNGRDIVRFMRELIPLRAFRTDGLLLQIRLALNAVFYGVIFVAILQATAGAIVWWIAGLPNPFFFGAVMFILSIIPFAGPSFVLIPAGIFRIYQGEVLWGVILILSGVIFVGSIDNVLRPIMVSRFGKINPAMVVVGLAGGLVAFGVVGIVLGPLIFALWVGIARELHYEIEQWKVSAFHGLPAMGEPGGAYGPEAGAPPPGEAAGPPAAPTPPGGEEPSTGGQPSQGDDGIP